MQLIHQPNCHGDIWYVSKTLPVHKTYVWVTEKKEYVVNQCNANVTSCTFPGIGLVMSIYTEQEAKNVIECSGMSEYDHEMRHLNGYDHLNP